MYRGRTGKIPFNKSQKIHSLNLEQCYYFNMHALCITSKNNNQSVFFSFNILDTHSILIRI